MDRDDKILQKVCRRQKAATTKANPAFFIDHSDSFSGEKESGVYQAKYYQSPKKVTNRENAYKSANFKKLILDSQ